MFLKKVVAATKIFGCLMAFASCAQAADGLIRWYQPDSSNIFIGNDNFEIGLSYAGAFGTTANAPTSGDVIFHPYGMSALSFVSLLSMGMTGDYFIPGTPVEGWYLIVEGNTVASGSIQGGYSGVSSSVHSNNSTVAYADVTTTIRCNRNLVLEQNLTFAGGDMGYLMTVRITNNGDATLTNVKYRRQCDPDQREQLTGSFHTDNYFYKDEDGNAYMYAFGNSTGVTESDPELLHEEMITKGTNPYILVGLASDDYTVDAYLNFGYTSYDYHQYADDTQMGLVFTIDSIAPGETVELYYIGSIDPRVEPEMGEFRITFDANGGTSSKRSIRRDAGVAYGELPTAKKTGHTFLGWFTELDDGEPVTPDTVAVGDATNYAHWAINSYTISFDSKGGSEVPSITANYGTALTVPDAPALDGHTFGGWFRAGRPFAFTTMPAEDVALDALWLDENTQLHAGSIDSSATWTNGSVHIISGVVTIQSGVELIIEPGAVVKFLSGASLTIASGGICRASGAIFTHINDDSVGGDTMMDGDETKPEYDAYDITTNGQLWEDETTEYRYMKPRTLESSISTSTRLKGHTVYKVNYNVTVYRGATLTIPAGTILKFGPGYRMTINSGAKLEVNGTRTAPVVFTSIKDDENGGDTNGDGDKTKPNGGDWTYVYVSGSATLNYCHALYGAPSNETGILEVSGGTLTLMNCLVAHSRYDGVWNWGGTIKAYNTVFTDCGNGVCPYRGSTECDNCIMAFCNYGYMDWSHWYGGTFKNCIFYGCGKNWSDTNGSAEFMGHSTVKNCCFFNPEGYSKRSCVKDGVDGCIYADPRFLDADNGDFRIAENSPCVDAGDGTVAPARDYWNQPRMDVKGAAATGKGDLHGICPDIGIYEVLGTPADPTADLTVKSVSAPTVLTVGGESEVSWVVTNVGPVDAEGVWCDRIDFVADNGSVTELATLECSGVLTASNEVERVRRFVVPMLQSKGRIRVTTNVDRGIFEGKAVANNAAQAGNATTVGYPDLVVGDGETVDVSVPAEGEVGFRLGGAYPDGGLLVIAADREIVARLDLGRIPTADTFVRSAVSVGGGYWIMQVPADATDAYVAFSTTSDQATPVSVSTLKGSLLLLDVGVMSYPNAGTVTVPFYGNGFDESMEVWIEKAGRTLTAADVSVESAVKGSAVFDVDGLPTGTWTLKVRKGGETVSCERLTLTAGGMGAIWSCKIDAASSVRAGRVYMGNVVCANSGDRSMIAPYVHVTAKNGTQIRFSASDAWTDSLEFMATSESYPARLLKPGEEIRVPFYYQATGSGVSISVESSTDDPSDFPWETNGGYMRPSWATDEMWTRALAILKKNVGLTWNACFQRLNADADHLMKIGTPERRFDRLWQMEINEALGVDHAVGSLAGGTDLARSGRGFGLSFSRSYGSGMHQRLRKGVLGYGWSDNLSVSCELQESGARFVIQSGDGGSYAFTKVTGAWKPEDARDKTVMTESYSEWVLTTRSGTVIRFSKSKKRIVSIRDNMGNGLDFTHDASGNVTEVKHTDGQWLRFTYSGGLLVSAADDRGRTASYAYTGEMLTEVTAFNGRKVKYNYLPADETAASRALRQIVASDGQTKDFTYDAAGRVATASRNGTHFTSEIVRGELGSYSVIAPNGGITEVTVGANGETLSTVNALGQKVQRTYTADTLLESVIAPSGKRSKIVYDTDGQAVKSLDAAGAATSFAYTEDFGSLKRVTDARQKAITYGYDALGRSESVSYPDDSQSRIAYAANGDVTNAVNARGESIAYAYDKEGNKIAATWPNGRTFAWTYDAKGNCVSASDSVTGEVTMEYDDKEQLTRITYPGGRGFTYVYNAYGRVTARTSLDGYAQKYEYDAFGRVARMTDGSGNPYVVNAYDPVTGNLMLQTYGNGTTVSNAYDLLDRTVSITHRKADGTVLERFAYAYNEDGQRISLTTTEGVENYTYDAAGQVTGVIYPNGTQETFEYDAVGNRLAANGTAYTVNDLNQYAGVGSSSLTYDADGNLLRRADASGTTDYYYDCESRLIGVTNTSSGVAWSCEYDVFGNRVRVTDNGVTTEKLYIQGSLPSVAAEYRGGSLVVRHILLGSVRLADVTAGGTTRYYHADGLASTRLLTDASGSVVARASYKAFGEIRTSSGVAIADGYVGTLGVERDSTGLLFMRNRYYDAGMGRFVQRDPIGLRGRDVNWYRYCRNESSEFIDPDGMAAVAGGIEIEICRKMLEKSYRKAAVDGAEVMLVKVGGKWVAKAAARHAVAGLANGIPYIEAGLIALDVIDLGVTIYEAVNSANTVTGANSSVNEGYKVEPVDAIDGGSGEPPQWCKNFYARETSAGRDPCDSAGFRKACGTAYSCPAR